MKRYGPNQINGIEPAYEADYAADAQREHEEFEAGRKTALAEYLKKSRRHPPNPHNDINSNSWKYWHRGWLTGCDEVLRKLRKAGKCIDV